jgi:hypothetical protein
MWGQGKTPLVLACKHNNKEMVEALLKAGANPNLVLDQFTLLYSYIAERGGDPDIVGMFLRYGADIEATSGVASYTPSKVPLLVPEVTTYGRWTPLHGAVRTRNRKVVELLLQNGANVNAVLSGGQTPLDIALAVGDHELATVIKESGGGRSGDPGVPPPPRPEWDRLHTITCHRCKGTESVREGDLEDPEKYMTFTVKVFALKGSKTIIRECKNCGMTQQTTVDSR